MPRIIKWGGKILKVGGKIAKGPRCCCGGINCAAAECQCPRGTAPGDPACYTGCYLYRIKTGDFTACDPDCGNGVDDCATANQVQAGDAGSYLKADPTLPCPCVFSDVGPDGLGTVACACTGDCLTTTPVTPTLTLTCVESGGECVVKAVLQWDTATWELVGFDVAGATWQTLTKTANLGCSCNTPTEMEVQAAACP